MRSKVVLVLLVGILLSLVFGSSLAYAITLQLPFDAGQYWGPRTYENHNVWGSYDNKLRAIDWFYTTSHQDTCSFWASSSTASQGMNLRAAHAGTIYILQANAAGYGNYLVIRSSEDSTYFTLYAHLNAFKTGLATGQTVAAGDLIGYVGSSGSGSGGFAHLHFELEHGNSSSDWVPQDISTLYIDGQTVDFASWGCSAPSFCGGYAGKALYASGGTPTYGSITGTVTDKFNVAISGATVATTTGGYTTTTNSSGNYTLSNVLVGSYTVNASKTSFISQSNTVGVSSGVATVSNFSLQSTTGMTPATPTGTNMSTSATATTDSDYSGAYTGIKAIDGVNSSASKWCSAGTAPPHWIALDLNGMRSVNGFVVYFAGSEGELTSYNFKNFQIQSATSLAGPWTDEVVVNNATQANSIACSFQTRKTLRYVRLYVTNTGIDNYARLPEFQVICASSTMTAGTPAGTNMANLYVSQQTDSYYDASYTGAKALDNTISAASKWCSGGSAPPHWLAVDLGTNRLVNGFIVYHAGAAGEYTTENTKNFSFQAAPTMSGPWTDEVVVNNTAQANSNAYYYNTQKWLRYVRLYITNSGIDSYARIPEFQVFCAQ